MFNIVQPGMATFQAICFMWPYLRQCELGIRWETWPKPGSQVKLLHKLFASRAGRTISTYLNYGLRLTMKPAPGWFEDLDLPLQPGILWKRDCRSEQHGDPRWSSAHETLKIHQLFLGPLYPAVMQREKTKMCRSRPGNPSCTGFQKVSTSQIVAISYCFFCLFQHCPFGSVIATEWAPTQPFPWLQKRPGNASAELHPLRDFHP